MVEKIKIEKSEIKKLRRKSEMNKIIIGNTYVLFDLLLNYFK